jgi:hypothetical protein
LFQRCPFCLYASPQAFFSAPLIQGATVLCRLRKQPPFPLLADAVKAYFKEQTPDLSWLT